MRPITANSLTTAEVRSPSGEDLGKIVDFMLDTERGCVVYAVLATGGVLGVGAKMLAVPPRSLQLSGDRCLELDVDTAALDAADGIDRANPPESADATLRERAPAASTRAVSNGRGRNHG
jgi:sporulation protein YlmC with PRC-barrel domain